MGPNVIEYEDGRVVELDEDDAPELTDEFFLWAVSSADFNGDHMALRAFLDARTEFLAKAEAEGIPKETFLPFEPNKPGFEDRAKVLLRASKLWAAE